MTSQSGENEDDESLLPSPIGDPPNSPRENEIDLYGAHINFKRKKIIRNVECVGVSWFCGGSGPEVSTKMADGVHSGRRGNETQTFQAETRRRGKLTNTRAKKKTKKSSLCLIFETFDRVRHIAAV